jgi:hypothetical protein
MVLKFVLLTYDNVYSIRHNVRPRLPGSAHRDPS